MSERGQVAVEMPITRYPSDAEQRQLLGAAAREAQTLVARNGGGRVLGFSSVSTVNHSETNGVALRFVFAVEAPEHVWHKRKSFAVKSHG